MSSKRQLAVTLVVGGNPTTMSVDRSWNVRQVIALASADYHTFAEWELRTADGSLIEGGRLVADALHEGETYYLNPRAGAGG